MGLFRRRKPAPRGPGLTRAQALAARPSVHECVNSETLENGLVRLSYPLVLKPWYRDLAKRLGLWKDTPLTKTIELDEMGSFVWTRMDGEAGVEDLAAALGEAYGLSAREAELSVTAFLRELGQRGLVGLRPGKHAPEVPAS